MSKIPDANTVTKIEQNLVPNSVQLKIQFKLYQNHNYKMNDATAELLQEFKESNSQPCEYCGNECSYNDYKTTIAGQTVSFCSEWCILVGEREMRRNWMRAVNKNANKK